MFCTQCGANAAPGAKSCSECGAALAENPVLTGPKQPSSVETPVQPNSTINKAKTRPSGVGGWLLLLVIGMMVIGPLMGAVRTNTNIMVAEYQYPNLTSLDKWKTFKSVTWWMFLIFAATSFYGGLGLTRGRDWSVVNRAQIILWITGPIASIVLKVIIPTVIFELSLDETDFFLAEEIGPIIGSTIGAIIWTAYLSKSKRVHNTYGGS